MNSKIELRLRLPLLWLLLLFLAAILLPDRIWNTVLIGMGGMFGVAFWWARELRNGLRAQRVLRFGWVAVGDRLEESFTMVNDGLFPALWVEIQDESNVPGYTAAVVRSVGSRNLVRWREAAVCTRRGQFHLGPWSLQTSDPFGIFRVTISYPKSNEVIIHPPIHGRLPIQLPSGQSSGRRRVRHNAWQATMNAANVRPYQPTDPHHWIHWPTSARKQELYVRQFDLDAGGDVWLVLDLQTAVQLGSGISGTEEHAVLLAASLAARSLRQNRAVGLATYGQQPQIVPPAQGQGHQWEILRALALVEADGVTDLGVALQDLGRVAQRGTTAVIITPSPSPDWIPALLPLAQRGIQSTLILLDPPSFDDGSDSHSNSDSQSNSDSLRSTIRQLGFNCDIVRQGEIGIPLQEQQKRGHWDFRVTATGKAIAV